LLSAAKTRPVRRGLRDDDLEIFTGNDERLTAGDVETPRRT
jgi:hypothetical protein